MAQEDAQIEVVVRAVREQTGLVKSYELAAMPGTLLPAFEAGAHIDLYLPAGVVRPYSLANDPADPSTYVIGVKLEQNGRGGSRLVHEELHENTTLRISPPKGRFMLRPGARRSLLLAAGIGITPILSMTLVLARLKADFTLHYFCRTPDDIAFRQVIDGRLPPEKVAFQIGAMPPHLDGVLDGILGSDPADTIYVCGPAPFLDAVKARCAARGIASDRIVTEHFSTGQPSSSPEGEFVVRLDRSGREISVPHDRTLLEALREAGIDMPTSCEQGVCGTCLTSVLEGVPEHNDLYLNEDERESGTLILPCVSRALSRMLVLDL